MSRFSRLQYSIAALAFVAALGTSVQAGHAGQYQLGQVQAGPFQRESMLTRSTMNERAVTLSTQQQTNTVMNRIRIRKDLGAGPTPDG